MNERPCWFTRTTAAFRLRQKMKTQKQEFILSMAADEKPHRLVTVPTEFLILKLAVDATVVPDVQHGTRARQTHGEGEGGGGGGEDDQRY